jgi:hypothetical protein
MKHSLWIFAALGLFTACAQQSKTTPLAADQAWEVTSKDDVPMGAVFFQLSVDVPDTNPPNAEPDTLGCFICPAPAVDFSFRYSRPSCESEETEALTLSGQSCILSQPAEDQWIVTKKEIREGFFCYQLAPCFPRKEEGK